jgi:hypothetical protein
MKAVKRHTALALFFALFMSTAAIAAAPPDGWVEISPANQGFTGVIPAGYTSQDKHDKGSDSTLWIAKDPATGAIYLVVRTVYASIASVSRELSLDRDNFLKGVSATLDDQHDIVTDGNTGIEFTAHSANAQYVVRFWVRGNDAYGIAVAGQTMPALSTTFLSSFHITNP